MYCYTMYWYTKVLVCKGIGMQRSSFASSKSLNPLKRVNSILTEASSKSASSDVYGLNPLKRVNSILTAKRSDGSDIVSESQSPQTGQFNSYIIYLSRKT